MIVKAKTYITFPQEVLVSKGSGLTILASLWDPVEYVTCDKYQSIIATFELSSQSFFLILKFAKTLHLSLRLRLFMSKMQR